MAALRHPPTLLLLNLPKQALVGIDFLSLTASQRFNGFTSLPSGWHFLFVGATIELSSRQGLWFYVPELHEDNGLHSGQKRPRADSQPLGVRGEVMASTATPMITKDWLAVLEWEPETEKLQAVSEIRHLEDWRQRLLSSADLQSTLFPYRQSVQPDQRIEEIGTEDDNGLNAPLDFVSLSNHVTPRLLDRICGHSDGAFWGLDTASSTDLDAEAESIPGLEDIEKFKGQTLGLSDIDLKRTWPENAVGRERTAGARDRSWRLDQVIQRTSAEVVGDPTGDDKMRDNLWGAELLGEMQFCFTSILTLANWSCMAQWRRILELVMTCLTIVPERPSFFASFLALLSMQLTCTSVVEGGLFDVKDDGGAFLQGLLRRFNSALTEVEPQNDLSAVRREMLGLQTAVKNIWGWEFGNEWVRRGMVQLEDGEMVELETQEMEDEDERGEYAPVIVDLE